MNDIDFWHTVARFEVGIYSHTLRIIHIIPFFFFLSLSFSCMPSPLSHTLHSPVLSLLLPFSPPIHSLSCYSTVSVVWFLPTSSCLHNTPKVASIAKPTIYAERDPHSDFSFQAQIKYRKSETHQTIWISLSCSWMYYWICHHDDVCNWHMRKLDVIVNL